MRILLVTDFYAPFLGGVELQTQLLAEELSSRGHEVSVATVWHEGLAIAERAGGVEVHRLRGSWMTLSAAPAGRRRYHPPFPDPLMARRLARLIRAARIEVVDSSGWIAYSARLAAEWCEVPFVLSARDFGYVCPTRTFVRRGRVCEGPGCEKCLRHANAVYGLPKTVAAVPGVLGLRRWLDRGCASLHVPSSYVETAMRRHLASPDRRVELIPEAISLANARALPEADEWLARLPDRPFILFVGALQQHKGIGPLLDAFAALNSPPPLVVVGTRWPDSPSAWPDGVTVLSDVPNAVVREIWDRALFGVLPSLVPETFGLVTLEAMRSAKPIVASALGGPLDVVEDGETGFLVPPGDAGALRAAMQTLVDDAALRERMGRAGRARVAARFSTEVVIPRYESFYATVAGAGR